MKQTFASIISALLILLCLSLTGAETGSAAARITFRKLLEKRDYPLDLLEKGMKDKDPVIRPTASTTTRRKEAPMQNRSC